LPTPKERNMKVSYKGRKVKGSDFERLIAKKIQDAGLDDHAKRTPLSGAVFGWKGDITTPGIPIHWELKCQESWSPLAYYSQALEDRPNGRYIPVVVMGKNRTDPYVFFSFDDFLTILFYALKGGLKENT